MKRAVFAILFLLAIFFPGRVFASEATLTNEQYLQIADRIIEKVVSLKDEYPHFAQVETKAVKEQSTAGEKFGVQFEYDHGMTWVDNPQCPPGKKCARTIPSFAETDGIRLSLYFFFEGDWRGQAAVRPIAIGKMNVVIFLDGPKTEEIGAIYKRIRSFIEVEEKNFVKEGPVKK